MYIIIYRIYPWGVLFVLDIRTTSVYEIIMDDSLHATDRSRKKICTLCTMRSSRLVDGDSGIRLHRSSDVCS